EVGRDPVIELESRSFVDRGPQLPSLTRIGHPCGLAAFDAKAAPPANIDQASKTHRLEQEHRVGVSCPKAHLVEPLLSGVRDRRGEHGARNTLAAMRARDAQSLVPDQAWSNRPEALHPDDHTVQLGGLEGSAGVR